MKFPAFVLLFLACGVATLSAQTNGATTTATNTVTNTAADSATNTATTGATNGVDSILALVTTNRPATPKATNQPDASNQSHGPITIASTGPLIFDMNNHWVTYSDNVRVTQGQMKLKCEWLKALFSANGDQVQQATNIVAETNVVVDFVDSKGQKGRAIGTRAVYQLQVQHGVTNETVTLTGNLPDAPPEVMQGPNYTNHLTGTKFTYDVRTRIWNVEQPSGIFFSTNSSARSNSPMNDALLLPK